MLRIPQNIFLQQGIIEEALSLQNKYEKQKKKQKGPEVLGGRLQGQKQITGDRPRNTSKTAKSTAAAAIISAVTQMRFQIRLPTLMVNFVMGRWSIVWPHSSVFLVRNHETEPRALIFPNSNQHTPSFFSSSN